MKKQIEIPTLTEMDWIKKAQKNALIEDAKSKMQTRFLINVFIFLIIEAIITACRVNPVCDITISFAGFSQPTSVVLASIEVLLIASLILGEIQDRLFGILRVEESWITLIALNILLIVFNMYAIITCKDILPTLSKTYQFTILNREMEICVPMVITLFLLVWTVSLYTHTITNIHNGYECVKDKIRVAKLEKEKLEELEENIVVQAETFEEKTS